MRRPKRPRLKRSGSEKNLAMMANAGAGFSLRSLTSVPKAPLFFGLEPCYPAVALPEFDIVSVHKLLCRFRRRFVVGAVELNGSIEMAIPSDNIRAVVGHVMHPGSGESAILTVTDRCQWRGGDGGTMPDSGVGWLVRIAHTRKGIDTSLTNYVRRENQIRTIAAEKAHASKTEQRRSGRGAGLMLGRSESYRNVPQRWPQRACRQHAGAALFRLDQNMPAPVALENAVRQMAWPGNMGAKFIGTWGNRATDI